MRQLWLLGGICLCIVGLLVLFVTTIVIPTAPWNGDLPAGEGNSAVVTSGHADGRTSALLSRTYSFSGLCLARAQRAHGLLV